MSTPRRTRGLAAAAALGVAIAALATAVPAHAEVEITPPLKAWITNPTTGGVIASTDTTFSAAGSNPCTATQGAWTTRLTTEFLVKAEDPYTVAGMVATSSSLTRFDRPYTGPVRDMLGDLGNTNDTAGATLRDAIQAGTQAGDYLWGIGCVGWPTNDTEIDPNAGKRRLDPAGAWVGSIIHFDGAGNWSLVTDGDDDAAPTAPTGLSVTPGEGQLAVSWNAVTATPAVDAYKIVVTAGGSPIDGSPFSAGTATSATLTSLTPGVEYTVSVIAHNTVGDGPASATQTGTPTGDPSLGDDDVPVTIEVPKTGIELVVPDAASAALGTAVAQEDGSFRIEDAAVTPFTVNEYRSAKTGWHVTAQLGTFAKTGAPGTTFTAAGIEYDPTVTGTTATAGTGNVLATAATGEGAGATTIATTIGLTVPAGTADGDYTSTLTLTLINGQ